MNEQILYNRPMAGARLDMAHPLTKGLVGFWLLNEQGMRAMDLSPYGNHGLLTGATSRSFNGQSFSGSAVAVVPHHYTLSLVDITIEAWVTLGEVTEANIYTVICKDGTNSAQNNNYQLDLRASGGLANVFLACRGDDSALHTFNSANALAAGQSHHIVLTKKGTGIPKIYINGTSMAVTGADAVNLGTNTLSVYLGQLGLGGNNLKGKLHLVSLRNYPVTPGDVAELYVNPYALVLDG